MSADVAYVSASFVTAYVLGWGFGSIFLAFKTISEKV